jgi:hypothetical protein
MNVLAEGCAFNTNPSLNNLLIKIDTWLLLEGDYEL